eukprot:m.383890 g.383890  ORF g.383890 m.383890 type:complete len:499 (-) comp16733_c0_seq1:3254-4750(-)
MASACHMAGLTTAFIFSLSCLVSASPAKEPTDPSPYCVFTNKSSGNGGSSGTAPNKWWLECQGAGLARTLTMGVNHVENCDPNATSYGVLCEGGLFGPPRFSSLFHREVCPWFCDSWDKKTNMSVYHLSTMARYSNTTAWAATAAQRLLSWGFNTLGAWSSPLLTGDTAEGVLRVPAVSPPGLVYGYTLDMLMSPFEHRFAPNPLVDVFDPSFAENCTEIAKRHCAPRRTDTRLLGYWLDNEIPYNPNYLNGSDLIGSALRIWSAAGQGRVTMWLSSRYSGDIQKFCSAWNVHISNWSELASINPLPMSAARTADNTAFMSYYYGSYLETATAAIKAVDPNHMILGSRLLSPDDALLKVMGKYVDVVDVHCYDAVPCTQLMVHAHEVTGLPVLMSEFGFRARDSALPNTKGAGPLVMTQTERAAAYRDYTSKLVSLPFVIGYHMFMYYDEPPGQQLFGADSNFGLVHEDDDVYEVLTKAFTGINADAPGIHEQAEPAE